MSLSHCLIRYFLTVCILCCTAGWSHAQSPPAARPTGAGLGQMRVVESQPPASEPAAYTVVGEVLRPGVYLSSERSIALRRMLDAAGGLSSQAQAAARIIRGGEVRFQVPLYQEPLATEEWLLPGDIVVIAPRVVPQGNSHPPAATIPVACVGLTNHPVVLPLDPSIKTVTELARRLGQSPQLAQSARVIDPVRSGNPAHLSIGSVIFFDARLVDPLPFQPGFFPAAIDMSPPRTSAVPESVSPDDFEMPPDVPPVEAVQQASGDLIPPQSAAVTNSLIGPSQRTRGASSVPPMSLTVAQPQPAIDSTPSTESADELRPRRPLPPDLARAVKLFAPPVPPLSSSERPFDSSGTSLESASEEKNRTDIQTADASEAILAAAPSFPVMQTSGLRSSPGTTSADSPRKLIRSSGKNESRLTRDAKSLSASAAAKKLSGSKVLEYLMYCAGALSILIGSSLLISVAFDTSLPSPAIQLSGFVSSASQAQTKATADAPVEPVQAPREPSIRELLKRAIPIVEEPVEIPSGWPLHGKVIGHRRCLLNTAHDEIATPHFRKRQKSSDREKISVGSTTATERLLRNNLREILQRDFDNSAGKFPLEDSDDFDMKGSIHNESSASESHFAKEVQTSMSDASLASPVPPPVGAMSTSHSSVSAPRTVASSTPEPIEFDIVQPQRSPLEQTSAMSPLERALRILAEEKPG